MTWTLVFPNWSKYFKNSITCAPLHRANVNGGLWFFRYCKNVFQSRRFWDSYRLGGAAAAAVADGPWPWSELGPGPVAADDGPSPAPLLGSDDVVVVVVVPAPPPEAESMYGP